MTEDVCRRWLKGKFRWAPRGALKSYEVRYETKRIFLCF